MKLGFFLDLCLISGLVSQVFASCLEKKYWQLFMSSRKDGDTAQYLVQFLKFRGMGAVLEVWDGMRMKFGGLGSVSEMWNGMRTTAFLQSCLGLRFTL